MMRNLGQMLKISMLGLSLAAFIALPVAQSGQRHNSGPRYNSHNSYNSYNNYNRHNNRYSYNRHNSRYGYNNYNYGRSYGYNSRRRHGNGGAVALGVLTGGLLYYALSANERRNNNNQTVYVKEQPYSQPTQQKWTRPAAPAQSQKPRNSSCLQTREYQTTITVGNQTVPAYGQSCLQPDGSWKLGPAIPEPGY